VSYFPIVTLGERFRRRTGETMRAARAGACLVLAGNRVSRASSIFWRVFATNAVVLIAATLVLAFSPATVSFPVRPHQAYVLMFGLVLMLLANALLLRVTLAPLRRLAGLMGRIDLLQPGQRLRENSGGEVRAVVTSFNQMLDRLERERRLSSARVLGSQEEERRRIAHELHDEVGQGLTALLLQLKNVVEDAPPELRSKLFEAQETVRTNLEEVRRIARQLRPTALDDLGLVYALRALADNFASQTRIGVAQRVDEDLPPLPAAHELAIYRVAQEGLTNAARHGHASHVEVTLKLQADTVMLRIVDDGVGLPTPLHEGGGIRGMRERAVLVGGRFGLEQQAERATVLELLIPMREVATGSRG
jgi:two-component system sensor histidine kinase UhpB